MPVPSKLTTPAAVKEDHYHIQTHGGLGDCLWVYKKLMHLPLPLFVTVSQENRSRPRRVGQLLDHLPRVVGAAYADCAFAPGGQDWTQSAADPACAIGRTWADLGWEPNTAEPYRIECNRWLEGGNRIEGWLPDLPATHRVPFLEPDPPTKPFDAPAVVFGIAGWPDVADETWLAIGRMFARVARVYVVGGSYDRRPRRVFELFDGAPHVALLEDVPWRDLYGVLAACAYCFGHASGFTAVADAIGCKGATFNPRCVPRLTGTWNDPDNAGMVQTDRHEDFDRAAHAAYQELARAPGATWPPGAVRGAVVAAAPGAGGPGAAAVYAAARAALPKQAVFVYEAVPEDPGLVAACVDGVFDAGDLIYAVALVGADARTVAAACKAAARASRPPTLELPRERAEVLERPVTYGLAVVVAGTDPRRAFDAVAWAWAHVAPGGTLLVGGPAGRGAFDAVARARRVAPADVAGAPGWAYLHRSGAP